MDESDLWMLFGRLSDAILHVIRIGDDETCPFCHKVIHQLGHGQSWSVGGIDFIKIKHFHPWKIPLNVKAGIVMSVAPTPVIERTDQKHAKDKRFFRGLFGAAGS